MRAYCRHTTKVRCHTVADQVGENFKYLIYRCPKGHVFQVLKDEVPKKIITLQGERLVDR